MQNDKQNNKQTNKQNRAEKHNNSTQTLEGQKEAKRIVTDTDKKRGQELLQNFQKQYPESYNRIGEPRKGILAEKEQDRYAPKPHDPFK